ncbi:Anhydro-N-acetylmuramic acid kinase [Halomicronema hongdechloris C2206]|uniref:Anhydro-N-acetylmuramic acid kinase n=1 Tax=Halomicronema hongdechloris C2206 TaxID=1641165 RepID=A0A1Z3HV84_9CYAN|nr:anhydro-N-acetylmuramic acid kinase [Halomicronema hongdechloris]ASC74214.1 Anhydro-N-acetylmuramic acid kinase [Halomicronema hongdechloris C2206]
MRVLGLISGTSADGIDAALVEIHGFGRTIAVHWLAGMTYPYPEPVRSHLLEICAGQALSLEDLADLDDTVASVFADAVLSLQANAGEAELIASHGQTVFHRPRQAGLGYSIQLGRGAEIARLTGLPTISDFRTADIAAGGQGAPLVSALDACLLSHPQHRRCVQNIGGISNVTYLPPWDRHRAGEHWPELWGWDTGPGNTLLDIAVQRFSQGQLSYDQNGAWAAQGTVCQALVEHWMGHPFFHQPPPKSTGRELFGWHYLDTCLAAADTYQLSPADCLASLSELTAVSIAHSYRTFLTEPPDEVFVCGGGSRNHYLMQRLAAHLDPIPLLTTDQAGLPTDFKEAIAFAVLGYWRQQNFPGNVPTVTGAQRPMLLGQLSEPVQLQA